MFEFLPPAHAHASALDLKPRHPFYPTRVKISDSDKLSPLKMDISYSKMKKEHVEDKNFDNEDNSTNKELDTKDDKKYVDNDTDEEGSQVNINSLCYLKGSMLMNALFFTIAYNNIVFFS